MADRYIEYMPVSSLREHPENPKAHAEGNLDESLDEYGYTESILIDERTGFIVSGHGRKAMVQRAQHEGDDVPDGIRIDADTGEWLVPVSRGWSSRDDLQAKSYLVAANQLTIKGGWLDDPLLSILSELADSQRGLGAAGFTQEEFEDMLASVAGPPDLDSLADELGDPDPDDFWPVLRFKIPPPLRARYLAVTQRVPGGDAEQFEFLVHQAELRQGITG